jgi:hypothetical protein
MSATEFKSMNIRVTPEELEDLERIAATLYTPLRNLIKLWVAQCRLYKVTVGSAKMPPKKSSKPLQMQMPIPLADWLSDLGGVDSIYWIVQKNLSAYRNGHVAPALPPYQEQQIAA